MASFSLKLPSSLSSGLAASCSSCSSSSSSFYSLRCANVPGQTLIRSPAPRLCPSARCPIPSSRGARLARSPVTSSFHCGQRTTTALTMRRWAATMATRSTLSRRCPHRVQPTSTTKFEKKNKYIEKKREERLIYVHGKKHVPLWDLMLPQARVISTTCCTNLERRALSSNQHGCGLTAESFILFWLSDNLLPYPPLTPFPLPHHAIIGQGRGGAGGCQKMDLCLPGLLSPRQRRIWLNSLSWIHSALHPTKHTLVACSLAAGSHRPCILCTSIRACACVSVCTWASLLVRTLCWAQEALQIAQVLGTVYELMCSSPFAPLTFALLKYFWWRIFLETLIQFTKQLYFVSLFPTSAQCIVD